MPVFLADPSVLSKERLRSELLAHSVELPAGNPTKDVYVRLYLQNLTAQNQSPGPEQLEVFSSDDELPPATASTRGRSSGRKAIRKTERPPTELLDVTLLTDEGLRDQLIRHGVEPGPVVASTRQLYEKKLQKLLDNGPVIEIQVNGNSESEVYSDQENEPTPEPEPEPVVEPEPEPEPVPVVERAARSRGKAAAAAAVSSRTRSGQQALREVEKIEASESVPKTEEKDVLKEIFSNNSSPTGISATCRRPIRGAAGRPLAASDFWNDENSLFKSSRSFTETQRIHRVTSPLLSSSSSSSSSSRLLTTAPPAAPPATARRSGGVALWKKLCVLVAVAAFLFTVYQAMESDASSPFQSPDGQLEAQSAT